MRCVRRLIAALAMACSVAVSIALSFLLAWVLAGSVAIAWHFYGGGYLVSALVTGLTLWAGFTAGRMIVHDVFAGRPSQLTVLNIAHELVLRSDHHNVVVRPLDPPAHRTIAMAIPPESEGKPLVRTFAAFVRAWAQANP